MSLIYVTGLSGTGKSAVLGELRVEAARSGGRLYLCGGANGDRAVWHLFDKVLALVADVPTLRQRIAERTNEFGKAPGELAAILGWHASYETAYRRFGAVIIDARQALDQVVAQVLAESASNREQAPRTAHRRPPDLDRY